MARIRGIVKMKKNKDKVCECGCGGNTETGNIGKNKSVISGVLALISIVVTLIIAAILLSLLGCNRVADAAEVTKVTIEDFRTAQKEAKDFFDKAEFDKACDAYLKYADIGDKLGKPELKAWGLNNAAHANIQRWFKDQGIKSSKELEGYLLEAKGYLDAAMKIKEASKDCMDKITSNYMFIASRIPLPPKAEVTGEKK